MDDSRPGAKRGKRQKGILVGAGLEDYGDDNELRVLDELAELAKTAGVRDVGRYFQRRANPDAATFIGKGKVEEICNGIREEEADVVLFDKDLTPRQVRNLEERLGMSVLDRSEVILDIFATHARTLEARLQVELAQLRYTRPRLKRMWTHLSRIAGQGGIGSRGPGEKQIETDRRIIDRKILGLERELDEIQSRKVRQVATRDSELTVSLVGYTNAGKSTLMNRLTGAGVEEANKLFATLDTKTSDFELPNGARVLLSDTVGFIKNLPHHLVASFHATLEETRQAKLLLHVVDAASSEAPEQIKTVRSVLETELDLGEEEREEIVVYNKVDAIEDRVELSILQERHGEGIAVSAATGEGIDELIAAVADFHDRDRPVLELAVPLADGKTQASLNALGEILDQEYGDEVVRLRVRLPMEVAPQFEEFRV